MKKHPALSEDSCSHNSKETAEQRNDAINCCWTFNNMRMTWLYEVCKHIILSVGGTWQNSSTFYANMKNILISFHFLLVLQNSHFPHHKVAKIVQQRYEIDTFYETLQLVIPPSRSLIVQLRAHSKSHGFAVLLRGQLGQSQSILNDQTSV